MTRIADIMEGNVRFLRSLTDGHVAKHPIIETDISPKQGHVLITVLLHQDAFGPDPSKVPTLKQKNRYLRMTISQEKYMALPKCTYHVKNGYIHITSGDTGRQE